MGLTTIEEAIKDVKPAGSVSASMMKTARTRETW
jgi:hypothetical protein